MKAAPSVTVTLHEDAVMLQEAVVIGYGTVKKNDVTGSVMAIDADKMVKGMATSASDLLVGKAAGVSVITDGGAPGPELRSVCVEVHPCRPATIR